MTPQARITWALIVALVGLIPQTVAAQPEKRPTVDEVTARIEELIKDPALPENDLVLYEEQRRLEDEIAKYRRFLVQLKPQRDELAIYDSLKSRANKVIATVIALDCAKASRDSLLDLMLEIRGIGRDIFLRVGFERTGQGSNPWDNVQQRLPAMNLKDDELCKEISKAVGDSAKQKGLLEYFDSLKQIAQTRINEDEKAAAQLNGLIDRLQQRRAKVQDKLASRNPQQQLSNLLWVYILLIGMLSLASIAGIKLFSENLQVEWVTSGQVIQFVTVMILLSVVMALGIASVLKEQTLGTLLGGIAGYVLSQGVGRAVAQAVARGLTQPLGGTPLQPPGTPLPPQER